jgi:hypothetical protein
MLSTYNLHRQCKITGEDLFDFAENHLIRSEREFTVSDIIKLAEIMQNDFKIMMEDQQKERMQTLEQDKFTRLMYEDDGKSDDY